ncbi:hypothetical protein DCS_05834 [Drechmeria coniospora]|uniref:Uncharacterized protein n=1 Tax=Drechmeria coniospora TaxID=98403 RepID=A0A151GNZ6_DRECN|nr:hypothetical protein DCS_05834 [Drechmeria coniospora]KYK58816.1 hypothetical protein DCS_05834 [Drechmeria coniospora]
MWETFPIIAQLKTLVQAITGDVAGARKTNEEFIDAWTNHLGQTASDLADGVPVIGHVKGIVHFIMGDVEAAIHSEEAASRTLVVLSAAALTAGTGGLAAPVLAGVVGGLAADTVVTDNVISKLNQSHYEQLGGDLFDGIVLGAMDRYVGRKSVAKSQTTRIYRVEGKSMIRMNNGESLKDFFAGDNQRVFEYKGQVVTREKLPGLEHPESLSSSVENPPPSIAKPKKRVGKLRSVVSIPRKETTNAFISIFDPNAFKSHGRMIFLNFGNAKRMYGYYAQKLIDHRKFVAQYRKKYAQSVDGSTSKVTPSSHQLRVKSFEVMTRDLSAIEVEAISEYNKHLDPQSYKGVLVVDAHASRQYGLENWRYTPIFEKMIPNTFRKETPWIAHLPTPVLKLIRDNILAGGKIRTFKYVNGKGITGGSENVDGSRGRRLSAMELHAITGEEISTEDVIPDLPLLHCRHVKRIVQSMDDNATDWTDHYEYLVKFDEAPPEWVPADFISIELRRNFFLRAMKTAKPVGEFMKAAAPGFVAVKRPDGEVSVIEESSLFWREEEVGTHGLDPREVDSILYHLQTDDHRPPA